MKQLLILLLSSFGLMAMAPQNGDTPVRQWPTITVKTADGGQFSFEPALLERLQSDFLRRVAFDGTQFVEFATGQPVVELSTETGFDREIVELIIKVASAANATRIEMLWNLPVETLSRLSYAFDFLGSAQLYQEATVNYLVKFFAQATTQDIAECRQDIERMVHRVCVEPFHLTGNQACLLYCGLKKHNFDPTLASKIEKYTAHNLLDNAQFFAQSLAPDDTTRITDAAKKSDSARQPEWYVGLPICPFAEFLCESRLMYRQSLPSHVASKLIRQRTIPGRFKALSSNGRYVCVETDDELFVYETHGGRRINDRPLPGNTANFSKDGKFVAVGNHSLITIYITEPMAQVGQPVEGDSAWFSHDERFVEVNRQSQITSYTTEAMEQIGQPMAGCSFTGGSRFIVVGNPLHHQITIYAAETLEQIGQPIEGYGDWLSCDERFVAVCNGARIIVYKTETLEQVGQPTTGDKAEFSPDAKFIAVRNWVDHHQQITLYTTEAMEQVGQPITGDAAGFSPDAKFIAVRNWVDAPSQITLYTTETVKQIGQPIEGYGFSFSPDGSLVAVSKFVDQHFQTTVYKTETLEQIGQPIEGHEVQFSPDGRFMWITNEEMATLYTLPSMKVVHQIERVFERHFGGNIYAFGQTNALTLARDTLTFAYLEGSDSTHQMACLAAMYRKDATDETARLLDEKSEWWTRMSINAPAKIQQFVRAQFPAPEQAAGATPEDDDVFWEARGEDAPGIIAAPTAAAPANTDESEQSDDWLPCKLL